MNSCFYDFVSFQYIKPFGGYKYTDAAAKLREIGRYCILKRIESIKNGEQDHHDILTQIITLTQKQGNINLEDLIDDFVTFYVAGILTIIKLMLPCIMT